MAPASKKSSSRGNGAGNKPAKQTGSSTAANTSQAKAAKESGRKAAKRSADRKVRPARSAGEHESPEFETGPGGETHQTVLPGGARLTTQQGTPVADDQNTLKAGERGPSLLEDFHFREKIFHFDHERIPERVVHARGF